AGESLHEVHHPRVDVDTLNSQPVGGGQAQPEQAVSGQIRLMALGWNVIAEAATRGEIQAWSDDQDPLEAGLGVESPDDRQRRENREVHLYITIRAVTPFLIQSCGLT